MPRHDSRPDEQTLVRPRADTKRPRRYRVLFHNDDFTTMEFVVEALITYFHRTIEEATAIMLEVHQKGRGVAGVYPRDQAETRVAQVSAAAEQSGFPLLVTMEPEA